MGGLSQEQRENVLKQQQKQQQTQESTSQESAPSSSSSQGSTSTPSDSYYYESSKGLEKKFGSEYAHKMDEYSRQQELKQSNKAFLESTARSGQQKSQEAVTRLYGKETYTIPEGPYSRTYVEGDIPQNVLIDKAQTYGVDVSRSTFRKDSYQPPQETTKSYETGQMLSEQIGPSAYFETGGGKATRTRSERITPEGIEVTETESKGVVIDDPFADYNREFSKSQRETERENVRKIVSDARDIGATEIIIKNKKGDVIKTVPIDRAELELVRTGRQEGSISIIAKPPKDTKQLGKWKESESGLTSFVTTAKSQGAKTIQIKDVKSGETKEVPIERAQLAVLKESRGKEVEISYQPVVRGTGTRDILGENVVTKGIDEYFEFNKPIQERSEQTTPVPFFGESVALPSKRAIGEFTAPAINVGVETADFGKALMKGKEGFKSGEFGLPEPVEKTPKQPTTTSRFFAGEKVDLSDPYQRISMYGDIAVLGGGILFGGRVGTKTGLGEGMFGKVGGRIKKTFGRTEGEYVSTTPLSKVGEAVGIRTPSRKAEIIAELQYEKSGTPYAVTPTKTKGKFEVEAGTEGRDILIPKTEKGQKEPIVIVEKPQEPKFPFEIGRKGEKVNVRTERETRIPTARGEAAQPFGIVETGKEGVTFFVEKEPIPPKSGIKVQEKGVMIVGTKLTDVEATRLGVEPIEVGESGTTVYGGRMTPQTKELLEQSIKSGTGKKLTDISMYPTEKAIKAGTKEEDVLGFGEKYVTTRQTIGVYGLKDVSFFRPERSLAKLSGESRVITETGGRVSKGRPQSILDPEFMKYETPIGSTDFENYLKRLGLYEETPSKIAKSYRPFSSGKYPIGEMPSGGAGGTGKAKGIMSFEEARSDILKGLQFGGKTKPKSDVFGEIKTPIYQTSYPTEEVIGPSIFEPEQITKRKPSSRTDVLISRRIGGGSISDVGASSISKNVSVFDITSVDTLSGKKSEFSSATKGILSYVAGTKGSLWNVFKEKSILDTTRQTRLGSSNIVIPKTTPMTETSYSQKTSTLQTQKFGWGSSLLTGGKSRMFVFGETRFSRVGSPGGGAGGGGGLLFGGGGTKGGFTEVVKLGVKNPFAESLSIKADFSNIGIRPKGRGKSFKKLPKNPWF